MFSRGAVYQEPPLPSARLTRSGRDHAQDVGRPAGFLAFDDRKVPADAALRQPPIYLTGTDRAIRLARNSAMSFSNAGMISFRIRFVSSRIATAAGPAFHS